MIMYEDRRVMIKTIHFANNSFAISSVQNEIVTWWTDHHGSDNDLSPGRRQAIIWTNAVILLIGPIGTNFSEILIQILTFSFKKMRLKVSSVKRRPFCLGLNVLKQTVWSHLVFHAEIILL